MAGLRRDPYAILGMARGASRDEIAAAFRRLAKAIHPDVASDASPDMRDLNWAWHVLSDPARRRQWDAAHPMSDSHWGLSHTATAGWSASASVGTATPTGSTGGTVTDAHDEPRRFAAFGCFGLLLIVVLLLGFVLISAVYSGPPGIDPGGQEVHESRAP
jgi:hypothetical protein